MAYLAMSLTTFCLDTTYWKSTLALYDDNCNGLYPVSLRAVTKTGSPSSCVTIKVTGSKDFG